MMKQHPVVQETYQHLEVGRNKNETEGRGQIMNEVLTGIHI